jgi:hypothetical protein
MADRNTNKKAAARKATATAKRTTGTGKATASAAAAASKPAAQKAEVLNATGHPRLGKGGLEALVLGHMKLHPKVEFTSTELSHKLERSNGAIQNALEKFAKAGTVKRTSERPRRYRYAGEKAARRATGTKKKAA